MSTAPTPTTDPVSYRAEVPVRWSDMDVFQHVNHARMVTLLEEARIDWLRSVGPEASELLGTSVVAHIDVRYRSPLTHADSPLSVTMWIERLRTVDVTVRYEVRAATAQADSRPAVEAVTQLALGDPHTQRLRRLTADERALLATWVRG
ncbi:acyl-CoA thioester hydrolase [Rhodococcus sp. PvR044]|jgi:acyl-CoA thioester hydrolase|uniref:acyl-CoA thioesterase n=1 Tax=unclassified Rhodococcus (in: high G+C Gram-positive bacteria) TaxID=192944 RepID=UPI000BD26A25|nr:MULTISPECIES: thioesterase family protein [unclassified Rhodococcus (in: high G+C Gram-positive bacteria)]PTR44451.1 acyl-CoA thioester hydrolase [Rhodococcus sp. OK611]SNX89892.1 acyl-CoA thioester hydrolase [Rhodococcus sp. OK270]